MSRKHKNIIDVEEAVLDFQSSDFEVQAVNYYQLRVWAPESKNFYDWYHTSGTVVVNRVDSPAASLPWCAYTAEQLMEGILKQELSHAKPF